MHELVRVLRRVVLDDPVDIRDVDTSGCQVCRQEHLMLVRLLLAFELVVNLASFLLIYLAVELKKGALVRAEKSKYQHMEVH